MASGGLSGLGPGLGGVAAVTFLTAYRLAELLGAPSLAAVGRRPVSTPVIAAALRRALRDDPGIFAPVAEHPATETALVATFAELSDVSEDGLFALAGAGRRAHDVVGLYRRARDRLAGGWYHESDPDRRRHHRARHCRGPLAGGRVGPGRRLPRRTCSSARPRCWPPWPRRAPPRSSPD